MGTKKTKITNTKQNLIADIETLLEHKPTLKAKFEQQFKDTPLYDFKSLEKEEMLAGLLCWCNQQTIEADDKIRYVRIQLLDKTSVQLSTQTLYQEWFNQNPQATADEKAKAQSAINEKALNWYGTNVMLYTILAQMGNVTIHADETTGVVLYAQVDKNDFDYFRLYKLYPANCTEGGGLIHSKAIMKLYDHVTKNTKLSVQTWTDSENNTHQITYTTIKSKPDKEVLKVLDKAKQAQYIEMLKNAPKTWNLVYLIKDSKTVKYATSIQLNEHQVQGFKAFLELHQKTIAHQEQIAKQVQQAVQKQQA